ncbi:MAG TPA: M28 family peptidase [Phycisphaerales bacterium]|nr:M28 family peptidase [Phycisphaerales bacterium]
MLSRPWFAAALAGLTVAWALSVMGPRGPIASVPEGAHRSVPVQAPPGVAPPGTRPDEEIPTPVHVPGVEPAPEKDVSPERLMETLRALPTRRAAWGDADSQAGLRATEELVLARLRELGFQPILQEVDWVGGARERQPWHNIIVELPGAQWPEQVLVVGAHIDAVAGSPGADDNASGVAALLELARVLRTVPMRRTVRLCFFNLEEVGLVGSSRYAHELSRQVQEGTAPKPIGMIALDMLGFYSTEPNSQTWPRLPIRGIKLPRTADFIAVGGLLNNQHFSRPLIEAMRQAAPEATIFAGDLLPIAIPDFLRSDHAPFLAMGVPAVLISDTANFRSPHYHRATDTIETIDQARYVAVVRALVGGVYRVACADEVASAVRPKPQSAPAPEPAPVDPAPAGPGR